MGGIPGRPGQFPKGGPKPKFAFWFFVEAKALGKHGGDRRSEQAKDQADIVSLKHGKQPRLHHRPPTCLPAFAATQKQALEENERCFDIDPMIIRKTLTRKSDEVGPSNVDYREFQIAVEGCGMYELPFHDR